MNFLKYPIDSTVIPCGHYFDNELTIEAVGQLNRCVVILWCEDVVHPLVGNVYETFVNLLSFKYELWA